MENRTLRKRRGEANQGVVIALGVIAVIALIAGISVIAYRANEKHKAYVAELKQNYPSKLSTFVASLDSTPGLELVNAERDLLEQQLTGIKNRIAATKQARDNAVEVQKSAERDKVKIKAKLAKLEERIVQDRVDAAYEEEVRKQQGTPAPQTSAAGPFEKPVSENSIAPGPFEKPVTDDKKAETAAVSTATTARERRLEEKSELETEFRQAQDQIDSVTKSITESDETLKKLGDEASYYEGRLQLLRNIDPEAYKGLVRRYFEKLQNQVAQGNFPDYRIMEKPVSWPFASWDWKKDPIVK